MEGRSKECKDRVCFINISKILKKNKTKLMINKFKRSIGRKLNENKALKYAKLKKPYGKNCKSCKGKLFGDGIYCQECSYKQGICSMCGVKILDTKSYKQSSK